MTLAGRPGRTKCFALKLCGVNGLGLMSQSLNNSHPTPIPPKPPSSHCSDVWQSLPIAADDSEATKTKAAKTDKKYLVQIIHIRRSAQRCASAEYLCRGYSSSQTDR